MQSGCGAWWVRTLLGEWEETYSHAVSREKRRRELAKVEIPGLSEAAQDFLRDYRAGSREAGEVLIEEAGRGVMAEFRAVSAGARLQGSSGPTPSWSFPGWTGSVRWRWERR